MNKQKPRKEAEEEEKDELGEKSLAMSILTRKLEQDEKRKVMRRRKKLGEQLGGSKDREKT